MAEKRNNFITRSLQEKSIQEKLLFAVDFAYADLSRISESQLNGLRKRFAEFLGYVETPEHGAGYAGIEEVAGMDVSFNANKEPEDYELADFVGLQEKIKPVLKGSAEHYDNDIRIAAKTFEKIGFNLFCGSLTVHANDPDDAFIVTLFLLLSRLESAKKIWDCVYCGNTFYRVRRQKYCDNCKTRADRERVKKWRKRRTNKLKEAARAARRRFKMRSNK